MHLVGKVREGGRVAPQEGVVVVEVLEVDLDSHRARHPQTPGGEPRPGWGEARPEVKPLAPLGCSVDVSVPQKGGIQHLRQARDLGVPVQQGHREV